MRQISGYPLWLGHVGDARDVRSLLDHGIQAIVDLAASEPPVAVSRDLVYCRFPLLDGPGNPPWLLPSVIGLVAGLAHAGIPTLVYCSAGMSRTPVVVAAAIAQLRSEPLAKALAFVADAGPLDVSPGLLLEVQAALT